MNDRYRHNYLRKETICMDKPIDKPCFPQRYDKNVSSNIKLRIHTNYSPLTDLHYSDL